MASLTVETWTCDACGKESDVKLKCCDGCRSVYYCDVKCQKNHWDSGHKKKCKVIKRKNKYDEYIEKGEVHSNAYNLKDAKKYQKRALKMAKEHDEPEDIARSFCQKGDVLYKEGSYDKALKYFTKII